MLAVTWHYVQPALSSLDIGAEVKNFLSSILYIAALMKLLNGAWPCAVADVSKDRGLVQSPMFRRIVALCSRRRFEGSWPCAFADVSKDRGLVQSPTFRSIVVLCSHRRFECAWPCAVSDVSKDRGLIQSPTFRRIVMLEASFRLTLKIMASSRNDGPTDSCLQPASFYHLSCGDCESMAVLVEEVD